MLKKSFNNFRNCCIIFFIYKIYYQDEGSYSLKKSTIELLKNQGSKKITNLKFRSMWSFVFLKDSYSLGEKLHVRNNNSWGNPVSLYINYNFDPFYKIIVKNCKNWPNNYSFYRRKKFCQKNKIAFPEFCNCYFKKFI